MYNINIIEVFMFAMSQQARLACGIDVHPSFFSLQHSRVGSFVESFSPFSYLIKYKVADKFGLWNRCAPFSY